MGVALFRSNAVTYQPVYSPSLLGKNRGRGLPCTQAINLFTVITFGDSTFTTDEINAYLLIPFVLAVSSDFSPSTESDQEAAIVSEVGCFVLVIKHEIGEDQDEKEIEGRF